MELNQTRAVWPFAFLALFLISARRIPRATSFFVILNLWFTHSAYADWVKNFHSTRAKSRGYLECPSHHRRPELKVAEEEHALITSAWKSLIDILEKQKKNTDAAHHLKKRKESVLIPRRACPVTGTSRLATLIQKHWVGILMMGIDKQQAKMSNDHRGSVGDLQLNRRASINAARALRKSSLPRCIDKSKRNTKLDMDHIYVGFADYIWVYYFVGLNAAVLWFTGVVSMLLRVKLVKVGLLAPKPVEHDQLVANLCLESMQATRYAGQIILDGQRIGTWLFSNFPVLQPGGTYRTANCFKVRINLDAKRMVDAHIDGRQLTAKQATILIWHDTVSSFHTKLHAYANWGVNVENRKNPSARKFSAITVMYNHFGYYKWKLYAKMWHQWGWSRYDFSHIDQVFRAGTESGLGRHPHLHEIANDSSVVRFVHKLRGKFLEIFAKHKKDFPGVDGEALFIGTVLHSLDHTLMAWNMKDVLWLDVDDPDPELSIMAEVGRFVRAGFVDDLPGLTFNQRFKDGPHQFYRDVYEAAAKLSVKLADVMDVCIIK